jgi:hypothetical protein
VENEGSAVESRGNDVGLLIRLAFDGLVIGLVLVGFVVGVVLAATGNSSGPRRVSYFAAIACLEVLVGAVVAFAVRSSRPGTVQKLQVVTWWLLPLNLVVLYLLVA